MAKDIGKEGPQVLEFGENWETFFITDLYDGGNGCRDNDEIFIERKWPGTVSGCDCRFAWREYYGIYTGSCD